MRQLLVILAMLVITIASFTEFSKSSGKTIPFQHETETITSRLVNYNKYINEISSEFKIGETDISYILENLRKTLASSSTKNYMINNICFLIVVVFFY